MKGKNKLAPRLLGVTKDSVLRLDEHTKEILKVWPLTTVRRWAASPNTFTLDFGDYSDQYYSVQTTEGEQISQLIAGYIDIILKKVSLTLSRRFSIAHRGLGGSETSQGPFRHRGGRGIEHRRGQRLAVQVSAREITLRFAVELIAIDPTRATIVQHQAGSGIKSGKVQTESVAKPAIVRAADSESFC